MPQIERDTQDLEYDIDEDTKGTRASDAKVWVIDNTQFTLSERSIVMVLKDHQKPLSNKGVTLMMLDDGETIKHDFWLSSQIPKPITFVFLMDDDE